MHNDLIVPRLPSVKCRGSTPEGGFAADSGDWGQRGNEKGSWGDGEARENSCAVPWLMQSRLFGSWEKVDCVFVDQLRGPLFSRLVTIAVLAIMPWSRSRIISTSHCAYNF